MFARGCAAADGYEYGSECDNESHDGKKGGKKKLQAAIQANERLGVFFGWFLRTAAQRCGCNFKGKPFTEMVSLNFHLMLLHLAK